MVEQYITWLNERGFHPDDLEYRGFNGNTPLMLAALEGNAMMVSRLIEAGADLYAINNDYNGVLFNACYSASPEVIRLLVEAGADINDTNEEGTTALMYAASASRVECIKMLLSLGADTTLQNEDGFSAIELATNRDVFLQLRSA
ncbi:ankyrin repeat domain-containing protein [Sulfuricurvum sp.]|uniref:ankyrin repeat domain-containing protein n=1 Tax=Sulfuricurvum sp. TaxID=2025608 RepID=UPI0026325645|nr:ankyrin repeat domain-containing protein [Sulfuricurvum sp.]MDD2780009.1 ankyrin repeat domain-containing protein [Sulfuricurvum sp.]